jgi:hypothetical protein
MSSNGQIVHLDEIEGDIHAPLFPHDHIPRIRNAFQNIHANYDRRRKKIERVKEPGLALP